MELKFLTIDESGYQKEWSLVDRRFNYAQDDNDFSLRYMKVDSFITPVPYSILSVFNAQAQVFTFSFTGFNHKEQATHCLAMLDLAEHSRIPQHIERVASIAAGVAKNNDDFARWVNAFYERL